jgi:hypothetical protein
MTTKVGGLICRGSKALKPDNSTKSILQGMQCSMKLKDAGCINKKKNTRKK